MGKILGWIMGFVATIATGVAVILLTQPKPDVVFTLSDRIPLTVLDPTTPTTESVQQIEVKNIGAAKAQKIVIKIEGPISTYDVQKHSVTDNVVIQSNPDTFEVAYPELPPQAGFKLILRSDGPGLTLDDIRVSHDLGVARDALSSSRNLLVDINFWLFVGLVTVYLGILLYITRRSLIESWESRNEIEHPERALGKSRPLYVFNNDEWQAMRRRSIEHAIKGDADRLYGKVSNLYPYRFLNQSKPNNMIDADWNDLVNMAASALIRNCHARIAEISLYSYADKLDDILRKDMPINCPRESWESILDAAKRRYFVLQMEMVARASGLSSEVLADPKPDFMSADDWNELRKFDNDLIKIQRDREWYSTIQSVLLHIKIRKPIGDQRPSPLNESDWQWLKSLEGDYREFLKAQELRDEVESEKRDLEVEKQIAHELATKVQRQLDIIHQVLTDPTAIDRIESSSDTFASGNFENLSHIANLLKTSSIKPKAKR